MNKKTSAVDLTDLAIGILILGITVAIGARILVLFRDSRLTDLSIITTTNETTFINSTADALANTWVQGISGCANLTSGLAIPSANYTLAISALDGTGTLTNATLASYDSVLCNYTYYDTSEAQWSLPDDAATGLAEYGNWFDIIVIVGIAGLILALIFMAFSRKEGAGTASY